MENIINKLMEYYRKHYSDFENDLESLNYLRGLGEATHLYPMSDLNKVFVGKTPSEVLTCAYWGDDDDGEGAFNPGRKFFHLNGCGGIVSTDNRYYNADCLNRHTVGDIIENATVLYLSDGAQKIIGGCTKEAL